MLRIATVREKSTGYVYDCYSVASESDPSKRYTVAVRGRYACRCSCAYKQHLPMKSCKHMKAIQAELDEARRTATLHRKEYSLLR